MDALEQIAPLADVLVEMNVELDRHKVTVRDLLALREGSLVRLSRSAGDNVDLNLGGVVLCLGEIVIVENTVAVRITDFRN